MENKNNNLMRHWKALMLFVVMMGAIFFVVSSFLPILYRSNASILITQKNDSGMNAYMEVKSAQFNGKIIGEVISSNNFMEGVMASNEAANGYINQERDPEKKIEKWQENVKVSQVSDTGVLNIAFYAPTREDSKDILNSIIMLLQEKGPEYYGNKSIGIEIVNKPYYLNDPASPDLLLNTLAGLLVGIGLLVLLSQILGRKLADFLDGAFPKKTHRIAFFSRNDDETPKAHELRRIHELLSN